MIRVLFVCLGNICRSPMAEAIFRNRLKEEGLDSSVEVASAGVGHWHAGSPPHKGTKDILEKNGISSEGLTARQIREEDWDDYDYLIGMDGNNINDLKAIREKEGVVVQKLMDYAQDSGKKEVPDPYFTGNFEETYTLVTQGCEGLLEEIRRKISF